LGAWVCRDFLFRDKIKKSEPLVHSPPPPYFSDAAWDLAAKTRPPESSASWATRASARPSPVPT